MMLPPAIRLFGMVEKVSSVARRLGSRIERREMNLPGISFQSQLDRRTEWAGLGLALLLLAGCASPESPPPRSRPASLLVSLPRNLLRKDEGILSLMLTFSDARVVEVRKIPWDWDFETHWEDGGHVTASGLARHFANRVTDVGVLEDFLLIEVMNEKSMESATSYDVKVTLQLGIPGTQRSEDRTVNLSPSDLVIRPNRK